MELRFESGETLRVRRDASAFHITIGDQIYVVQVERHVPGEITFSVGTGDQAERHHVHTACEGSTAYVAFGGEVYTLVRRDTARRRRTEGNRGAGLAATMHSQVVSVLVSPGDRVTRGQALVVLEAMKMEMRVTAPHDGVVTQVLCARGQVVERGQPLVELGN